MYFHFLAVIQIYLPFLIDREGMIDQEGNSEKGSYKEKCNFASDGDLLMKGEDNE